jgi:hypothetical protein
VTKKNTIEDLSKREFLLEAAKTPITIPMIVLRNNDDAIKTTVFINLVPKMISTTGVFVCIVKLLPQSPLNRLRRYSPYCSHIGRFKPNFSSTCCLTLGSKFWCSSAIRGSPGMTRKRTKLNERMRNHTIRH